MGKLTYRVLRTIAHTRHAARTKYLKPRHTRGNGGRKRRARR